MDIVAIISEYNPFHKGHLYQLDEVKKLLPNAYTVSIMSPNFVQRGFPAVFDKYTRGKCAIEAGIDLAMSMPLVSALLSAEGFAESGIRLAKKIGVSHIAFGVETFDIKLIEEIAKTLIDESFDKAFKKELSDFPSLSYPAVRQKALEKILGKKAGVFIETPNNILAVEYVKAILKYAPEIKIIPIKRIGNDHGDISTNGEVLSASAIRKMIAEGENYTDKIPSTTVKTLINANKFNFEKYQENLYSVIISKNKDEILFSCGNTELAGIIHKNSLVHSDYNAFRASLSRKKHPETKIDRILTGILLGIGFDEYLHKEVEYATLLAMNNNGKKIISSLRKSDDIVLLSKGANAKNANCFGLEIELLADRIYARCMEASEEGGYFLKKKPFIIEE